MLHQLLLPLLLSLTSAPRGAQGLIPNQCVQNVTIGAPVCCPVSPNNGQVCGGPTRGHCEQIFSPAEMIPAALLQDDRLAWPIRFFSRACQCRGNYFGVACDECWLGWTGPRCDRREMRIKRDILSLPRREVELYKDVFMRSQTWPSGFSVLDESVNFRSDPLNRPRFIPASIQYYITFLHRYGARSTLYEDDDQCSEYGVLNFNHDGVVFPTWHRYFNLVWERMLGQIAEKLYGVKDFTVPYWDIIGLQHCDICNNDYIGAPGRVSQEGMHLSPRSIFYNATQFCQEPVDGPECYGCQHLGYFGLLTREWQAEEFPDQRDLDYVMGLTNYYLPGERARSECLSFHMALEGFCGRPGADPSLLWMHNKVHRMNTGSMCCTATSTNDPMFLLLHNFVDKIFATWMRRNKVPLNAFPATDVRPGHTRDSFMIGLLPLARNSDMFTDPRTIGYDFDDAIFGKHAENRMPPLDYS